MTKLTMYCLIARSARRCASEWCARRAVRTFALFFGQRFPSRLDGLLENLQGKIFGLLTFGELQNTIHLGPSFGMIPEDV